MRIRNLQRRRCCSSEPIDAVNAWRPTTSKPLVVAPNAIATVDTRVDRRQPVARNQRAPRAVPFRAPVSTMAGGSTARGWSCDSRRRALSPPLPSARRATVADAEVVAVGAKENGGGAVARGAGVGSNRPVDDIAQPKGARRQRCASP